MSEYTPTRGEIISALVAYRAIPGAETPAEIAGSLPPEEVAKYLAESERGLAEVERAAAEKAWEEGFDAAELDVFEHEKHNWGNDCIPNPYAKETQ